jgi:hypothetical protein
MEDKMKVDDQTVRDITARLALLPTAEDIASVRRDFNEKVCFNYSRSFSSFALLNVMLYFSIYQIRNDLQKGFQQHDEITSQAFAKFEQRVNNVRVDLNRLEEQMHQRIAHVSFINN